MVIVSGRMTSRTIFSRGPVVDRAARFALAAAADRGERTRPLGIVERVDQRQLAAAAVRRRAWSGFGAGRRLGLDAAAQRAGTLFVFLGLPWRCASARRSWRHRRASGLASPRRSGGGRFPRRARAQFLGLVAGIFLDLAALGVRAFARQPFSLLRAAGGALFGVTPLLGLVDLRIGKRAGARVDLVATTAGAARSRRWPRRCGPAGSCVAAADGGADRLLRTDTGALTGGGASGFSPGRTTRRFFRSTCTVLVRPCEKLWRTVSRSTPAPRFRVSEAWGRR